MLTINNIPDNLNDVVPQAIFWRPISYFSQAFRNSRDELDEYKVVTFDMGNWLRFDLRNYAGHPRPTTSLYLGLELNETVDIEHAINRVIGEFQIPQIAIGWVRGQPFEFGELPRNPKDRLREPEARLLALKVAAMAANKTVTTQNIIDRATELFSPSDVDLQPSKTRQNQPRWHQIIRNVISHRDIANGPFALGYARRTPKGLSLTQQGEDHLKSMGFLR